jgi:uncharacterized surface protein with fasciclin (FAS1) repeats
MLKINKTPNFYNIITYGTYDNHEFRIQDENGKIYINFKDRYKETDIEGFNKIVNQIKEQYLKTRKTKNPL